MRGLPVLTRWHILVSPYSSSLSMSINSGKNITVSKGGLWYLPRAWRTTALGGQDSSSTSPPHSNIPAFPTLNQQPR